jgi:hypothetical protein
MLSLQPLYGMTLSVYVIHDLSFAVTQPYHSRSHITFKFETALNYQNT